jgi:probable HAF family extracellular repeat protein
LAALGAAQEIRYTRFSVPNSVSTTALGINNAGDVVGFYDGKTESGGFVYEDGQFSNLEDPEQAMPGSTFPKAINSAREIVGAYSIGGNQQRAFLYTAGKFGDLQIPAPHFDSEADGINNLGQIVGMYNDGHLWHGYLYDRNSGAFATIDVPGAHYTWCDGINDSGLIALTSEDTAQSYQHAWLYDGRNLTNIDVPGYDGSTVEGINNNGAVTLVASKGLDDYGFVYQAGQYTAVDFPGTLSNSLGRINDHGALVGNFFLSESAQGAFLAELPPQ